MRRIKVRTIALAAVLIALTTVFTMFVRLPIPATQGYVNFSDVATYFAAYAFGPGLGFVAGGVGAALADLLGGYAQFALITLFAHGLQGLLAGLIGRKGTLAALIAGWAAGAVAMIGVYLIGEIVLLGVGPALAEILPNLGQTAFGGLVGVPLYLAVRRAYPPIARWRPGAARDESHVSDPF
ncbi:MAG: ECF transporter S component [Anaerolineae bacterium]|nr:ECF transporter S component [Anaerolineae bacterium]